MKKTAQPNLLFPLVFVVMFSALPCRAESVKDDSKPIRVLFLYGGHHFDEESMYAMLDSYSDVAYDKAEMPKALDLFKPGLEEKYDCLVMYDSYRFPFTESQTDNFKALLEKGIALVVLHHSTWGFNGWEDFANITGCQYFFKDGYVVNEKQCSQSVWAHGQTIRVKVADPDHPIMKDVESEFTIVDETYGKGYIHPDVHVLWTTSHPDSDREIAWTWKYGNSPVFTTLQGHDAKTYDNPNYRKTVHQAIRWTVSQLRKNERREVNP